MLGSTKSEHGTSRHGYGLQGLPARVQTEQVFQPYLTPIPTRGSWRYIVHDRIPKCIQTKVEV